MHTENQSQMNNAKTISLKRVFSYTTPYQNRFWLSVMLAIVLAIMAPVRPMLIQYTINNVLNAGLWNTLIWITAIQVGILIVETSLRFLFSFFTSWLGQTVVRDLRNQVYRKILNLNLSQFDKTPIGTLTTRTVNDIESINDIFAEGLIPIVADILSIIAILTAMFYTNWQLTLVCLMPFPVLLIATYFFKESVNRSFTKVRNAVAALNAFVQEHVTGMQIVQSFAVEDKEAAKFRKINAEHRNANIRGIFAYSVFFPVVEIVLASAVGLLVWYAGIQVVHLPLEEARLYTIRSGSILLDGIDINDFTIAALRKQIGVVLQDVFLFSGTILENVALRNPSITRAKVEHAAKIMGIHDFIMRLPGGYDYPVMERGATLSMGQRQLLSFLRTLLYDPSILILDEATSSVDPESEQLIQQAIDQLVKGRTSIIIAHRLSTIRRADAILVLDKGEMVEIGDHETLIHKGGAYAHLHEMQFGSQV